MSLKIFLPVKVITPPDINKLPPSLFLSSSGSVKKI
jgi:hypothetical protein